MVVATTYTGVALKGIQIRKRNTSTFVAI